MTPYAVLATFVASWPDILPQLYVDELERLTRLKSITDLDVDWLASLLAAMKDATGARSLIDPFDDTTPKGSKQVHELVMDLSAMAADGLASDEIGLDRDADNLEHAAHQELTAGRREMYDVLSNVSRGKSLEVQDSYYHYWVAQISTVLNSSGRDPIGLLSWLDAPNSWLGEAPVELILQGRGPEAYFAASQANQDSW